MKIKHSRTKVRRNAQMTGVLRSTAVLILLAATAGAAPEIDMRETTEHFLNDNRSLNRFYSLYASEKWVKRREAFHASWSEKLNAIPFESLDQDGKVDYLLIANRLSYARERAASDRKLQAENARVLPFATDIVALEEGRRALVPIDARKTADRLASIQKSVKAARKAIEAAKSSKKDEDGDKTEGVADDSIAPVQPELAKRCADHVDHLRRNLSEWHKYYSGFQPDFDWWCDAPYQKLDNTLKDYMSFLRGNIAGLKVDGNGQAGPDQGDVLVGEPIGRERLQDDIASEMLAYTPEELIKIGEEQLTWCTKEMEKAAKELGFDDWRKALESVKDIHVEPGEQAALVRKQGESAIAFIEKNELITIPPLCRETWRIEMMGAKKQLTIPYAAYGGQRVNVAFANSEMAHETKIMSMRGNNIHFNRIVTAHELIPGHHLQQFYQARHKPYRSSFSTSFFVEGWALYWETRLWDLDYARNAKDRIGMLFWRMHRATRIVVTLKYHLGQMTAEEMVSFIESKGHERSAALSEVRRFITRGWSPLYQCGYMIGGLQLRALHTELVGAGKMSERDFHDAVLRQGPIPNALIRATLTKQPLTRDWSSKWRFAD